MECHRCGAELPEGKKSENFGARGELEPGEEPYRAFSSEMGACELWTATWRTFRKGWTTFAVAALGYAVWIAAIEAIIETLVPKDLELSLIAVLQGIAVFVLQGAPGIALSLVLAVAADKLTEGEPAGIAQTVDDSFTSGRFGRYLATGVLLFLILGGGILLLVIPAVIWWVKYLLAPSAVVVEGLSARQALTRSSSLVKGRWFRVFFRQLGVSLAIALVIMLPIVLVTHLIEYLIGHVWLGMEEVFKHSEASLLHAGKPIWMLFFDTFTSVFSGTAPLAVLHMLLFKSLRRSSFSDSASAPVEFIVEEQAASQEESKQPS